MYNIISEVEKKPLGFSSVAVIEHNCTEVYTTRG